MKDSVRKAIFAKNRKRQKEKGIKPNPNLTDSGNFNDNPLKDKDAGTPFVNGGVFVDDTWQFAKYDSPKLYENYLQKFGSGSTGGGFGDALKSNNLELAWSRADSENQNKLIKITGKTRQQLEAMKDLAFSGQSFSKEKVLKARKIISSRLT